MGENMILICDIIYGNKIYLYKKQSFFSFQVWRFTFHFGHFKNVLFSKVAARPKRILKKHVFLEDALTFFNMVKIFVTIIFFHFYILYLKNI